MYSNPYHLSLFQKTAILLFLLPSVLIKRIRDLFNYTAVSWNSFRPPPNLIILTKVEIPYNCL